MGLVFGPLRFKFLGEIVDFLFFLVQDFVFLRILVLFASSLATELGIDVLDAALVRLHDLARIGQFLFLHLDLRVVVLDAVHQSLAGLWEGQVHLVGLKFKVLLALAQVGFLITQLLSPLLQVVGTEPGFGLREAGVDLLELLPLGVDVGDQTIVLLLEFLVLIPLLGVQVVELRFVGVVDLLDLLLVRMDFVFHVALL